MAENSKALVDARRILKLVRQKAYAATLATLEKAAINFMTYGIHYQKKYKNVTGNTWTSTTVGIFYKGKLVSMINKGAEDDPPRRVSLRKGERFHGTTYPDSRTDTKTDFDYVGSYGKGGQWGPTLGPWFMRRQHFPKRKTWEMVIAIPVSYAGYNPKIVSTMQAYMDELPNIVDYSIVRVENAPSQTDVFKEDENGWAVPF